VVGICGVVWFTKAVCKQLHLGQVLADYPRLTAQSGPSHRFNASTNVTPRTLSRLGLHTDPKASDSTATFARGAPRTGA
jgi:hypothetical protein